MKMPLWSTGNHADQHRDGRPPQPAGGNRGVLPAKPVFDLESRDLIHRAAGMRDDSVLASGRAITSPPRLFIGAADTPCDPPADWRPESLLAKAHAGARLVQTQLCFDLDIIRRYTKER